MVLYRQRLIKNIRVTNSFLANLALIDLLMAILVLPFSISTSIEHKWLFSDAFCDFNGMITVFVGSASILTMAAISIDRYDLLIILEGHREGEQRGQFAPGPWCLGGLIK